MNTLFGKWASTLKKNWVLLVLSMVLPTFGLSYSAQTAQRIYGSYSAFERSISVTALENFAKDGVIEGDLVFYSKFLKPQQLQELRKALVSPIKIHPVAISQFLYTPQGEILLQRLGEVIKIESRQPEPGFYALRSALILAAQEPEGLTLLSLMRKYPSSSIHIDFARTLRIATELEKIINETNRAVAAVSEKSTIEATTMAALADFSRSPNLGFQGRFRVKKQTIKFFDGALERKRYLVTDIYLPNFLVKAPVIVISHGLGTDSSNFEYIANHLASHGFAVVVPNHPGSDTKQLRSLLNGSTHELAKTDEFYNRPLDVKYILDQLESNPQFKNSLNLQKVGVFGQSLGGYTALALAGAKINFKQLQKNCSPEALKRTWNMSLLFQCRALELPGHHTGKEYNFQDQRVKAVIAVNPISSSIFGQAGLSQIQIPLMIIGGSDDTIAPTLYEQILPFSWITTSQKYLVILKGGTHFSVIGEGKGSLEQLALPSQLIGHNPKQARRYMNFLSLPFFQTYVNKNLNYSSYLNAAYAKSISHRAMDLSLIQSLTKTE